MTVVPNPVLRGFHPDPSIIQVDGVFYVATSTFEWFPGVRIYASTDLVNWSLAAAPLDRTSQLNLWGCPDSGGIWAPCLTHDGSVFYLIYTVSLTIKLQKNTHNYVVTAPRIEGPWSEPAYVNSFGFDPSFFHDEDGRKWVTTVNTDFRKNRNRFGSIVLQEYDPVQKCSMGPVTSIFSGSSIGSTEGPHLYRIHGWYYLITAEGGTGFGHAATVARSRDIKGPYEIMPNNPLLTSNPDSPLQRAGHADICQTPQGDWVLVHLCGRPRHDRTMLGRETAMQNIVFDHEGWPRLSGGGIYARDTFTSPYDAVLPSLTDKTYSFDPAVPLDSDFQSLRIPLGEDMLSLKARPGFLRLYGHEGLLSPFRQALVGRRLQAFCAGWEATVDYEPDHYKHMAGIAAYYNTSTYYYLCVTHEESLGRVVKLYVCDGGAYDEPYAPVLVPSGKPIRLKLEIQGDSISFAYAVEDSPYQCYGEEMDATLLSDEHVHEASGMSAFTGTFFVLCCQDMTGGGYPADFSGVHYYEKE